MTTKSKNPDPALYLWYPGLWMTKENLQKLWALSDEYSTEHTILNEALRLGYGELEKRRK